MAMPQDFWRDVQSLSIFRTKPCQRLTQDGICGWKSQCQYSHCKDWARRQPLKHAYSPMLCPNIRMALSADDGSLDKMQIDKLCPDGVRCPMAHSKEEVLFHPELFKTVLCDEYVENTSQRRKRNKCHRYYCPMAHGTHELRQSCLSIEYRQECLRAAELLPSDTCCQLCSPSWRINSPTKLNAAAVPFFASGDSRVPWAPTYVPGASAGFSASGSNHSRNSSDTTDLPYGWPKDHAEPETTDTYECPYTAQRSQLGPLAAPFIPRASLDNCPAFIDIKEDGTMSVGPRPPATPATFLMHKEPPGLEKMENFSTQKELIYSIL